MNKSTRLRAAALLGLALLLACGVSAALTAVRTHTMNNRLYAAAERLRAHGCSVANDEATGEWVVVVDKPTFDDRTFRELRDDLVSLKEIGMSFGLESRVTDKSLEGLIGRVDVRALVLQSPGFTDAALASVSQMPRMRGLVLSARGFHNRCLRFIERISTLEALTLGPCSFERGCLTELGQPRGLEALSCARLPLEAADLSSLARLPRLSTLDLLRCHVEPRDLEGLADVHQLRVLRLVGTDLRSDADFLGNLRQLDSLALESCTLAGSLFDDLCKLPHLQHLSLRYSTPTNDDSLAALGCLAGLKSLDLSGTEVTDGCVPTLMAMKSLKEAGFEDTNVSDEAIKKLRAVLADSRR